ncbi:hypothetical protein NUSPORA_00564 [Nucleospora cyclopteri]
MLYLLIKFLYGTKNKKENSFIEKQTKNIEFKNLHLRKTFNEFKVNKKIICNVNWDSFNAEEKLLNILVKEFLIDQSLEGFDQSLQNKKESTSAKVKKCKKEYNYAQFNNQNNSSIEKNTYFIAKNNNDLIVKNNKCNYDLIQRIKKNDILHCSLPNTLNEHYQKSCLKEMISTKIVNLADIYRIRTKEKKVSQKYKNILEINYDSLKHKNTTYRDKSIQLLIRPMQLCTYLAQKQLSLLNHTTININNIKNISNQLYLLLNAVKDKKQFLVNLSDYKKNDSQHFKNKNSNSIKLDSLEKCESQHLYDQYKINEINAQTKTNIHKTSGQITSKVSIFPEDSMNNTNILSSINFSDTNQEIKEHIANLNVYHNENNSSDFKIIFKQEDSFQKQPNVSFIDKVDIINKKITKNKSNLNTKQQATNVDMEEKLLNTSLFVPQHSEKKELHNSSNSRSNETNLEYNMFYGDLSSGEKEVEENIFSEDEEESPYIIKNYPEPCYLILYNKKPCILKHEISDNLALLSTEIDFLQQYWMKLNNSENDIKILPEKMSFTPGWHKYKYLDHSMQNKKIKNPFCIQICQMYGLENYFSLIFNMIRINTYTKKNQYIYIHICFELILYHLCSKYNLGFGKNVKENYKSKYYKFINNKNYFRLFKTKEYWAKKAQWLYTKSKEKAFKDFGISQSNITPFYLYNVLHLIPTRNSLRVAFVCYIYYASKSLELDNNLMNVCFAEKKLIIEKRKRLYKVKQEFQSYMHCAKAVFSRRIQ